MPGGSERRCIEFICPICRFQQKIASGMEDGIPIAVVCERAHTHCFMGVVEGRSLKFTGQIVFASSDDVSRVVRELAEKTSEHEHTQLKLHQAEKLLNFYRGEIAQLVVLIEAKNQSVENISAIDEFKDGLRSVDGGLRLS